MASAVEVNDNQFSLGRSKFEPVESNTPSTSKEFIQPLTISQQRQNLETIRDEESISSLHHRLATQTLAQREIFENDPRLRFNLMLWRDIYSDISDDGDLDDDLDDEFDIIEIESTQFKYEKGPLLKADCEVCFTRVEENSRPCCYQLICDTCMVDYLTLKIGEGKTYFACPIFNCNRPVSRDEIISRITNGETLEKYHRFLTTANSEPSKKTCPNCCAITEVNDQSGGKYGHSLVCEECSFQWCFSCHSPIHEGIKCKDNIKGGKALSEWTKQKDNGQRNARKCPKCKLFIQRISGCDHMRCTQCQTNFCYKCGGRHLKARVLFGNHYDRLSVLGCPHNFMGGKKKHLRRFVRGSVFSMKLVGITTVSVILIGLLPVAAAAAVVVGPTVGVVRLHRYLKHKKAKKEYLNSSSQNTQSVSTDVLNSFPNYLLSDENEFEPYQGMKGPPLPSISEESAPKGSPRDSNTETYEITTVHQQLQTSLVAEKDETTHL